MGKNEISSINPKFLENISEVLVQARMRKLLLIFLWSMLIMR